MCMLSMRSLPGRKPNTSTQVKSTSLTSLSVQRSAETASDEAGARSALNHVTRASVGRLLDTGYTFAGICPSEYS